MISIVMLLAAAAASPSPVPTSPIISPDAVHAAAPVAPTATQVIAVAISNLSFMMVAMCVVLGAAAAVYLITALLKVTVLRDLPQPTRSTLLRLIVGVQALALGGSTLLNHGGVILSLAMVLGASATPLLHDMIDGARALKALAKDALVVKE
jgi:hypothetical protein